MDADEVVRTLLAYAQREGEADQFWLDWAQQWVSGDRSPDYAVTASRFASTPTGMIAARLAAAVARARTPREIAEAQAWAQFELKRRRLDS